MTNIIIKTLAGLFTFFLFAFPAEAQTDLKRDILFMCQKEFGGRNSGSKGDSIVQNWVEERFKSIGLTPLSGNSYRQPFEVTDSYYFDATLRLKKDGAIKSFVLGKDFSVAARTVIDTVKMECIFIGYGLADSLHYLMKDKIAIMYPPLALSRSFKHDIKFTTFDEISSAGAKAIITVFPTDKKIMQRQFKGQPRPTRDNDIILLDIARESLPALIGQNAVTAYDSQIDAGRIPTFASKLYCPDGTIEIAIQRFEQKLKPANIIGIKKGDSDSFILVVAHYDHLKPNKEAGLIYPGANDNASGVAMMLRLAGNFSAIQTSSTLIFIAFGAEEMGCKGSEYFVENLPMDKDKIKMVVNLDMLGNLKNNTLYYSDPRPFNNLFAEIKMNCPELKLEEYDCGRSDHFYFWENNIPNTSISTGFDSGIIHTPMDREERIDYEGMEKIGSFLKRLIIMIDDIKV